MRLEDMQVSIKHVDTNTNTDNSLNGSIESYRIVGLMVYVVYTSGIQYIYDLRNGDCVACIDLMRGNNQSKASILSDKERKRVIEVKVMLENDLNPFTNIATLATGYLKGDDKFEVEPKELSEEERRFKFNNQTPKTGSHKWKFVEDVDESEVEQVEVKHGARCVACGTRVEFTNSDYGRVKLNIINTWVDKDKVHPTGELVTIRSGIGIPKYATGPVCKSCVDRLSEVEHGFEPLASSPKVTSSSKISGIIAKPDKGEVKSRSIITLDPGGVESDEEWVIPHYEPKVKEEIHIGGYNKFGGSHKGGRRSY